jgi:4-aminobutyrate aminotransferase-like enzyme
MHYTGARILRFRPKASRTQVQRRPTGPSAGWLARKDAATSRGVALIQNFFLALAENAELRDIEGHRLIDFAGNIGVLTTRGLILLTCGIWGNVIGFLYPITTPDAAFGAGLKILEGAIPGA